MPGLQLKAAAGWLRHSPATRDARRHVPLACAAAAVAAAAGRRPRTAAALGAAAAAGFARTYAVSRRAGRAQLEEHLIRLRRLRPDVLTRFYIECVGSMEGELELWPRYDQRKHEIRYRAVTREVLRRVRRGDTVVDVGCASGLVLDRVDEAVPIRRVGFDLARYGVHERSTRPDAPLLAQAVVEAIPLRDSMADVVVFSEVIEHLVDAYAGLREVSRICRPGGHVILTTNNSSEMPEISPLRDPLTWLERLAGRTHPGVLAFRNVMWPVPIDRSVDPLPEETPTYAPHVHFAARELIELAEDAGFRLLSAGSFEFPAPQSSVATRLRTLGEGLPARSDALADAVERLCAVTPGIRQMGTHHLLVFRKEAEAGAHPRRPWWPATIPEAMRDGASSAHPYTASRSASTRIGEPPCPSPACTTPSASSPVRRAS
jgi:SAM-dependent methyltransferase